MPPAVIEEKDGSGTSNNNKEPVLGSGPTKNQKSKPVRRVKKTTDEDTSTKKTTKKPTRKVRTTSSVLEEGTNSSPIIDHGANVSEPQQLSKGSAKPLKAETENSKPDSPRRGWWNRLIK